MNPTHKQVLQALPHVRYEIESFLLTPDYDHSNEALSESVYFRRMVHCRALYDFFSQSKSIRQKKSCDDNIVSDDFDFPPKKLYGPKPRPLLDRFNKDLLHITYDRLNRTAKDKAWPMEILFPPVSDCAKDFIKLILKHPTLTIDASELEEWKKLNCAVVANSPLQQSTSNIGSVGTTVRVP